MAHKSHSKLRNAHLAQLELRKGNRAQPVPSGPHRGSRSSREHGARTWELKLVD